MGAMMRWTPLKFTKKISNLKFIYQIYMIPASELKKGTFQEQFGTFTRPSLPVPVFDFTKTSLPSINRGMTAF